MWDQYRKTVIPVQMFIATFALISFFHFRAPLPAVLMIVLTLEFMSLIGAKWSYRLTRKIDDARNGPTLRP